MLTINDFLEMLTYCWQPSLPTQATSEQRLSVEDLETLPVCRWKGGLS